MTKSYHVRWAIDLDADSPEDAAAKALAIHRDPFSIAMVFSVRGDPAYEWVEVDLGATPDPSPMSDDQKKALAAFKSRYGRIWKRALSIAWSNGTDPAEPGGGYLRQIRNTLGPAWLNEQK